MREANWNEYKKLVDAVDYPHCQRVLLLKELHYDCSRKDIQLYFQGFLLDFRLSAHADECFSCVINFFVFS